jgi:hypothetical protein
MPEGTPSGSNFAGAINATTVSKYPKDLYGRLRLRWTTSLDASDFVGRPPLDASDFVGKPPLDASDFVGKPLQTSFLINGTLVANLTVRI